MNTTAPWRVRAVQLDLARQRETIPAIGSFIRFAREWGCNTLVLYLEGVVRTKSFPDRPKNQSYSPDDMRRIVEMAAAAQMDVVPCVSTIGHVEHFTSCRRLGHLCEDPVSAPRMFCPSNPKIYDFLELYLAEIAELFPGPNFHIGCDEADELGFCPLCRRRTREDLMIAHIRRVRRMMQSQGKRVWIWDDMLENASLRKLAQLPRDIVLCTWNYRSELMDDDGLQGHFNHLNRRDLLAIYEKLGFDVLICPSAHEVENTLAFTRIARRRRVLGGLQTVWELSRTFLPSVLPAAALAGALWSNPDRDPQQALAGVLRRLFPALDATAIQAMRGALIHPLWDRPSSAQFHLRGPLNLEEARYLQSLLVSERILSAPLRRLPAGLQRDMVEERLAQMRLQILAGRLRQSLPELVDPRGPRSDTRVRECEREIESLARLRARQWRRHRAGISPDRASASLRNFAKEIQAFRRTAQKSNLLLQARLFLWESYSMARLKIELRAADGAWRQVYCGAFKPVNMRDAQYTLQAPVRWTGRAPDRMRITVSGFGGQGVGFVALHSAGKSLVPSRVASGSGRVLNPRAVLKDDATVCFLGKTDTVRTVRQHRHNDASTIELTLKARDGAGA